MPKMEDKEMQYVAVPKSLWKNFEVLHDRLMIVGTSTIAPPFDDSCPLCGQAAPHEDLDVCPWRRLSSTQIGKKKNISVMQFCADFLAHAIAEKIEKK